MAQINDLCQDIDIMSGRVIYATELLLHKLFHALFLAPLTLVGPVDPCQHTQLVHNVVIDNLRVRAAGCFLYGVPRTGLKQCTYMYQSGGLELIPCGIDRNKNLYYEALSL